MSTYSDWQLEQFVLCELTESQMNQIEKALSEDSDLQERIKDIEASNQLLMKRLPPERFSEALEIKPGPTGSFWQSVREKWQHYSKSGIVVFAGAMACVLLTIQLTPLGILNTQQDSFINPVPEEIRLKGMEPHFKVYRFSTSSTGEIDTSQALTMNDILQVSYIAAGQEYGYILSVDGNGVKTIHLSNGNMSAELDQSGEIRLPSAYRLDNAPEFERFFFFTSGAAFNTTALDEAIDQLIMDGYAKDGDINVPQSLDQNLFVTSKTFIKLNKEPTQ